MYPTIFIVSTGYEIFVWRKSEYMYKTADCNGSVGIIFEKESNVLV